MNRDNSEIINKEYDDVISRINMSDFKKIIITGEKKCGKSNTLMYYAYDYSDNKLMLYVDYSDFVYYTRMSDKEYDAYYELVLVRKIIESLKETDLYKDIAVFSRYVNNEYCNLCDYLSTRYCINDKKDFFEKGTYLKKLLLLLHEKGFNGISLIVDHFDFVGYSSNRFQSFMSSLFDYFDQVVITSNDKSLSDKEKKLELAKRGYDVIYVDYSKNIKLIQEVLIYNMLDWASDLVCNSTRIMKLQSVMYYINDEDFINKLVDRTNGNIEIMLDSFKSYFINDDDIEDSINVSIKLQKELDKLSHKKILHI